MILEISNLSKHFHLSGNKTLKAVDNVSMNIAKNEIVGLVGESGSGKSTLGRAIVGLISKTTGTVCFNGEPLPQNYSTQDFRRYSAHIQMIFQDPYSSLNPRMTIEEILTEPLQLQKQNNKAQSRELAVEWLQRVGLRGEHLLRYPHEFSGGQRQRIGIARALIAKPSFVVCDEPISALDVSVQAQVVNLLDELQQSMGLTLLFIAHDLSMVRYISDRMAVMYLGKLVEIGPSNEVFFNPRHPYTKLLIESNPIADPDLERQTDRPMIQGEVPSPVNLPKGCRFAGRCPKVSERCRQEEPTLQKIATDSGEVDVACWEV